MSFKIYIDPTFSIGVVRPRDGFDGDELIHAMKALYEAEAWQPGYAVLWNTPHLQTLALTPEDIAAITALTLSLAPRMGTGKTAIVAADEIHRMIASLLLIRTAAVPRDRRLFRTMPDALAWLGLPDDYLRARELD